MCLKQLSYEKGEEQEQNVITVKCDNIEVLAVICMTAISRLGSSKASSMNK